MDQVAWFVLVVVVFGANFAARAVRLAVDQVGAGAARLASGSIVINHRWYHHVQLLLCRI